MLNQEITEKDFENLGKSAFEWVHRASLNKNNFCKWENRSKDDQVAWSLLGLAVVKTFLNKKV